MQTHLGVPRRGVRDDTVAWTLHKFQMLLEAHAGRLGASRGEFVPPHEMIFVLAYHGML